MTGEEFRLLAGIFCAGAFTGVIFTYILMKRDERRRIQNAETIYERAVRKANDETKD